MLFKYLFRSKRKNYLFLFICTILGILVLSGLDIMQGIVFMLFMNRATGVNDIPLWILVLGAFGFVIGYYLVSLIASYFITNLLKKIRGELVNDIFTSFSNYPVSTFLKNETASSISSTITTEVENLIDSYYSYILSIFSVTFSFILGLIYLGLLNVFIIIPILIFIVLILLISFLSTNRINKNYEKVFYANRYVIKLINNVFSFFTVSKMFDFKENINKRIESEYDKFNSAKIKARLFDVILEKINGILSLLMFFSIYTICVYLAIKDQMNAGEITSIIQVCGSVVNPFFSISYVIKAIANTKSTRDKIDNILKVPATSTNLTKLDLKEIKGTNITYAYKDKDYIIKNLSFDFKKGDIVAIIGESGSGKTTLLSILSKFITDYSGSILLNDSINLNDVNDESYYLDVKLLNQEPTLLDDTIKNNIILDKPFEEEKFNKIFKLLNLDNTFKDINIKIDTESKNYSLGEARRICLARLLYDKPTFILLDEPFASLDEENRLIIENALTSINDSCIIITSHIFSEEFKKHITKEIKL